MTIEIMPKFKEISPSKESEQSLKRPITVVSRFIPQDTIVRKHSHSWGQFIYAHSGVMSVVTATDRLIIPPEQAVWVLPCVEHQVSTITDVGLTSFYIGNDVSHALPKQSCVLSINTFLKTLIFEARKTQSHYSW